MELNHKNSNQIESSIEIILYQNMFSNIIASILKRLIQVNYYKSFRVKTIVHNSKNYKYQMEECKVPKWLDLDISNKEVWKK